jgi:hypothetical protein
MMVNFEQFRMISRDSNPAEHFATSGFDLNAIEAIAA